jgi:hypothetical protein
MISADVVAMLEKVPVSIRRCIAKASSFVELSVQLSVAVVLEAVAENPNGVPGVVAAVDDDIFEGVDVPCEVLNAETRYPYVVPAVSNVSS